MLKALAVVIRSNIVTKQYVGFQFSILQCQPELWELTEAFSEEVECNIAAVFFALSKIQFALTYISLSFIVSGKN